MSGSLPGTIRRLRRERGLSLKDVASQLGVHFTTVSSWERGRSEPPYGTLGRLAQLYGVTISEILGEGGPGEPSRTFRPLTARAAEDIVRMLEELRLAVCLGAELADPTAAAELAGRCGIAPTRLAALASGEATFRPTEIAALVRQMGSAGEADSLVEAAGEPLARPPGGSLARRIDRYLAEIRAYLTGRADRSHQ